MRARTSLLLSGGILAIVALLGATDASSATPPTSCTTADFRVDVTIQTVGAQTSYEYRLSNVPGSRKRANRFFEFLPPGLVPAPTGTLAGSPSGSYLPNGSTILENCPPSPAWKFEKTDDGYCFALSTMGDKPTLRVTGSDAQTTTVLIGMALKDGTADGNFQGCAIAGPGPLLPGSPLATHTENQTMANGCQYIMTADTNNIVVGVIVDPLGPTNASNVAPHHGEACAVTFAENICETDTGVAFCPPIEAGEQPIQGAAGGICYYPNNIKVTC